MNPIGKYIEMRGKGVRLKQKAGVAGELCEQTHSHGHSWCAPFLSSLQQTSVQLLVVWDESTLGGRKKKIMQSKNALPFQSESTFTQFDF